MGEKMEELIIERLVNLSRSQERYRTTYMGTIKDFCHSFFGSAISRLWRTPNGGYLNLGCGPYFFKGWVNADYHYLRYAARLGGAQRPDWLLDVTRNWRVADNHWDGILTEHVLEHLTYEGAVNALREAYRTLKPGKWLRIVLPDARKAIKYYVNGEGLDYVHPKIGTFRYPIEAIHNLAQCWSHKTVWDDELLRALLSEIGYENIREVNFREGEDKKLLLDSEAKKWESFYFEARKL